MPTSVPPGAARAQRSSGDELGLDLQAQMVRRLQQALAAQSGAAVTLIETHISFVLVCGAHAYKLKKALRNPFLDQSTLARRQQACQEELRLNRRLAADLYLAVVPVTGSVSAPLLDGPGVPIDMAVKMRAFAQDQLWDRLAARGELRAEQIDALVRLLGPFHAAAAVASPDQPLGSPLQVRALLLQNLDELSELLGAQGGDAQRILGPLRTWSIAACDRLEPLMARRLVQGRVRECHGDLHLGNVTQIEGRTTVFDGIEFNDGFRWIDVMSEIAFMAMDLHAHGLPQLAHRLVNGYVEQCGEHEGLAVLDGYMVHRALVRAKVELLRAAQRAAPEGADAAGDRAAAQRYLDLALRFTRREATGAVLMLTHGYSGSGKSTFAQGLLEETGAIRIRSDVERKRLAGRQPVDPGAAWTSPPLYGRAMTDATYATLCRLAAVVLGSGYSVILDACFLKRAQRDAARSVAHRAGLAGVAGVACVVLDFEADVQVLRHRLRQRAAQAVDPSDADEAVLAGQMKTAEPLQPDEAPQVIHCAPLAASASGTDWRALLQQLSQLTGRHPARADAASGG